MLGGHTTKALADGIARSQHIGVVVKEEHSSHLDPVRPLLQLRKDHPSKLVAGRVAGSGEHIGDLHPNERVIARRTHPVPPSVAPVQDR